jgi:CubicO group peptidase (beta-lactamase class C family)
MKAATALLVLASHLALAHVATAQESPDSRSRRVDTLFARLNARPSPGVAIAVVRDGKVLLRAGYGMANLEDRVPITPSTVFDIASVSKQFTDWLAMLVEQGKVKLTDDIRMYIPELPKLDETITIDHLLHHTSGLRDWPGTLGVPGGAWMT